MTIYYREMRLIILLLVMASCVEHYPFDQMQGERFSFSVDGNGKFQAVIRWGIDGIQYNERINANGYASGFELKANEVFYIQVDSNSPVEVTISKNNSKQTKTLTSGTLYQIKHSVNDLLTE